MSYLLFHEFQNQFPVGTIPFEYGGQAVIFKSKQIFAVKKFDDIIDFVIELNFLLVCNHPCILKPIAWSWNGSNGYIAMPLGQNLQQAIIQKKISIYCAIQDLKSAIDYMKFKKITHHDIHLTNIIFFNGKAMLIDFGCAELNADIDYDYRNLYMAYQELNEIDPFVENLLSKSLLIKPNKSEVKLEPEQLINKCLNLIDHNDTDLPLLKYVCNKLIKRQSIDYDHADSNQMIIEILFLTHCQVYTSF